MDGAELTTEEFAFLLGSVGATRIVDLDDPDLFPKTEKQQQKIFERGLEQLVEHGWVESESEDPAEAGLNPTLFQLVAVISAPRAVLSTSIRSAGDSPLRLLHYLANDLIVELDAPADSRYQIGVVASLEQLAARLSQFLGAAEAGNGALVGLDRELAATLGKLAAVGKDEAASAGLVDAGVPQDQAVALAKAMAHGPIADIVAARIAGPEVEEIVRATVYGEGSSAWLVFYTDSESDELSLAAASAGSIRSMLAEWIGEFGLELQGA